MKDRKITIDLHKPLFNILEGKKEEKKLVARLEPEKKIDIITQMDYSGPQSLLWLERWYDFRRIDWVTYLEYPEFTNKEINKFLNF